MMQIVTDAAGAFEFPRVPPIPVSVRVHLGPWKDQGFRSGPSVPLDLKPGQRAELDLAGGSTVVKGTVKLTGKVPADLDCTYSLNYLVQRAEGIAPPPEIARLGFDVRKGWRDTWSKTIEGRTYLSTLRHWFVKLAPDGTFRVSGVPSGEYDLAVEVYAKPSGCLVDPLARKVVRVTVTAADAARGELVLPEISAEVVPVPAVGDSPVLAFRHSDGAGGTLKDYRGKYTLVHFWASWCGPCKQQLPALRRVQERFAGRGLATLGISLDHHSAAWQTALKRLDLPWRQGRLDRASDAGISSVPAYWLLDPTGKIVAKVHDPDDLAKALAERMK
jgi:thiol-disulfide isomerase/thioredoxin